MKIGIISDTHGYIDNSILNHFSDCDEVWHAGDVGDVSVLEEIEKTTSLRAVYGNIDNQLIRKTYSEHLRFKVEDTDVWITHIGGYPGRYNPAIRSEIYKNPPDLFICGHSHILKIMKCKITNLLHINPGAAGKHGFHFVRTIVKLDINKGVYSNVQVIELGKRA